MNIKKTIQHKLVHAGIAGGMALTTVSCTVNPEATSAIVGTGTGLIASAAGMSSRDAAALGAGIGLLTYAVTKSYQINERQKRIAEQRARIAMRNQQARQYQYIAVPVPKQKQSSSSSTKSDLVVVDKNTGKPVNNKVYETTKKDQLDGGQVAKVGGYDAYVYSSFQGV